MQYSQRKGSGVGQKMTRYFCSRRSEAKMLLDSEQRYRYCLHPLDHNVLFELNYAFL